MMKTYNNLITELIERSDTIFNKIGRDFVKTPRNIIIECLGYTSFHIAGAILLLCHNNFNQEATILLRSLIENTINLKWILNKNTNDRIKSYFRDISETGLGSEWTPVNLKDRMLEVGFHEKYYTMVVKITHAFSHTNAESLDWTNIKPDYPLFSEEGILSIAYQMLGHIIEVLHNEISKEFAFYKDISEEIERRNKIKDITRHIR